MRTVSKLRAIALLAGLFALCAPATASATSSDIELTKTANGTVYAPGDLITFSLRVKNDGPDDSGAKVTDPLPAGLTFVSGDSACYESSPNVVSCNFNDLGPGESATYGFIARVNSDFFASQPAPAAHDHQLTVDKVERHVDLAAGETRTETLDCPSNLPIMTDGVYRVDSVDQGTGTLADVRVSEARSTDRGSFRYTIRNDASGRAQVKLFGVCLGDRTNENAGHGHGVLVAPGSGPGFVATKTFTGGGYEEASVGCPAGTQPVAPGFRFTSGSGRVVRSEQSSSGGVPTWVFGVYADGPATFEASIRCLRKQLDQAAGHTHDLLLREITRDVSAGPGRSEHRVSCGDYDADAKGITAEHRFQQPLHLAGSTPEPINRDFTLYNPSGNPQPAKVGVICLRTRVGNATNPHRRGTVTNTATAASWAPDGNQANNTSSVTVTVDEADPRDPAPPTLHLASAVTLSGATKLARGAAGRAATVRASCVGPRPCAGTVELLARTGKGRGRLATVARARVSLASGQSRKLALGLTRKGTSALRSWRNDKRVRVATRFDLGGVPFADTQSVKLK